MASGFRRGLDFHMRYFSTSFLLYGSPGWKVALGTACPPDRYAGGIVTHLDTGHVWVITDDPPEPWCGQHLHLGRWPD